MVQCNSIPEVCVCFAVVQKQNRDMKQTRSILAKTLVEKAFGRKGLLRKGLLRKRTVA